MTPEEFRNLLDACGATPEHWPPGARAGAERLLAVSQIARNAIRAQQEIDHWLARSRYAGALPDFAARAMRARQLAPILPVRRALISTSRSAAVAAAALLTAGLGTATGLAHARAEQPTQMLATALSTPGEAVDAD